MPFALAIIGIVLVVVGARGKTSYTQFKSLLIGDFTGDHNFFIWILALGTAGALGYFKPLQSFSRAFMALIIIAMFVKKGSTNGGFFAQFSNALQTYTPSASASDASSSGADTSTGAGLDLNTIGASSPFGALSNAVGAGGFGSILGPATTLFNTKGTTQAAGSAGFSPGAASGNDAPLVSGSTKGGDVTASSVVNGTNNGLSNAFGLGSFGSLLGGFFK